MFEKLRRKKRKARRQPATHDGGDGPAESSGSSTPHAKPLWLPSKVQGIVYSLRAQQKEWRASRSLATRWSQYSPSPLRRLKRLFSTSSEPSLSDSDGAQRFLEDEWDAGTLRPGEACRDSDEVGSLQGRKSSSEEVCSGCGEQEESFHWVDSSTSLNLKEPKKHYYVLTPGIAQQSDSSSGDLTIQCRHNDEDERRISPVMLHKDQDPAQGILDDKSLLQESVDGFLNSSKIPLSLCETKVQKGKCLSVSDPELKCVSGNCNMPIVVENPEKSFGIEREAFQSQSCTTVTKLGSPCSDDGSVPRSKRGMPPPSIVLQQPEQLTVLELSPAKPGLSRLHLKADVTDVGARKSPVTVQEWVDSLPLQVQRGEEDSEETRHPEPDEHLDLGLGAEAGLLFAVCPEVEISSADHDGSCKKAKHKEGFVRESSLQSDITSHTGSSMESYLESRRADPEEVLLSLGFGGTGGALQSDVSRIPHRFLQPSKVKGVAVDNFLQYQQDLIEKFESGFSGYRGLVGPSHTPSVIVAKIMEKLRDHERESSCRSSIVSHLSVSTPASVPPPPTPEPKKFSHVARRVMKRTSVASALSVLNPANREFLDSQGSKSPEIPRKRMIIGQRSFTFSGDGDLIEVEPGPSPPSTPHGPSARQERVPPVKRLVHKDSALSLATSASMTSIDSDSDTDDRSSESELRNRVVRLPPKLPCCSVAPTPPAATSTPAPTSHHQRALDKRLSSTSISSWEMDSSAHLSEVSGRASGLSRGNSEEGFKPQAHHNPLVFPRTTCESIDEDVNMEALSNPLGSSLKEKVEPALDVELGTEADEELRALLPDVAGEAVPVPPTGGQLPRTPTCLVQDQVCVLHRDRPPRRGSLKRQQRVFEDDDVSMEEESGDSTGLQEVHTSSGPPLGNDSFLRLALDTRGGDSFEMEEILPLDEEQELLQLTRACSDSSGFLEGDVAENCPSSNSSPNNSCSMFSDQVLGTLEDSCHSDGDCGGVAPGPAAVGAGAVHVEGSVALEQVPAGECDVWSMLGIWGNDRYMKRLSLPVVCVHDELGNPSRLGGGCGGSWRSCASDDGSDVACTVRKVHSAPQSLCDLAEVRTTTIQACGSFSNMFSFCSDESVVHVSSGRGGSGARACSCHHGSSGNSRRQSVSFDCLSVQHCGGRHSFQEVRSREPSKRAARDLQQLIHELTARGLDVGYNFDILNACHSEPQQAQLHASTLRLAVDAYKKRLSTRPDLQLDGLQECEEAQQELEVTRNICSRITTELRHIADLLDEEPSARMADVTCQMTELLREQTHLYEQLTSHKGRASPVLPPDVVSVQTSLRPAAADASRPDHCCCTKQLMSIVREEHGRLEQLIRRNTDELAEIRRLLCELLLKSADARSHVRAHSQ